MAELMDRVEEAIAELPPLPQTTVWLLELLRDPATDVYRLEAIIEEDQPLTRLLMNVANSPRFRPRPQPFESLHQALVFLGNQALVSFTLAVGMGRLMRHPLEVYGFQRNALWTHGLSVAFGASFLLDSIDASRYKAHGFTAGLIHDMGYVITNKLLRGRGVANELQEAGEDRSFEVETRELGITHQEVGAILVEKWGFTAPIVAAVRNHHDPGSANGHADLVRAINVADRLSVRLGLGPSRTPALDGELEDLPRNGFSLKAMRKLQNQLGEKTRELVALT